MQPDEFEIILVEDDAAQARLIETILLRGGKRVAHFASAEALFEVLPRRPRAALAIVDLALPAANGIEVIQRLLMHPSWCRVPVMVLTAHTGPEWQTELRRLPVAPEAFMNKPVAPTHLLRTVDMLLRGESPSVHLRRLERQRLSAEVESRRADELREQRLQQVAVALRETEGLLGRCRSSMAAQRQMETAARGIPSVLAEVEQRKRLIAEAIVFNEGTLDALRARQADLQEDRRSNLRRSLSTSRELEQQIVLAQQRLNLARRDATRTGTDDQP
ncbi:MAG: response regulator [Candidatus Eisenbacteria bacterium]|nr:response regulator [Candidatus Eisenbacteria bacterium]